jgi:hypothetical protein
MQKKLFSICIPSNRNFSASAGAMQSAINYSKRSGCQLVVSDNAQDAEKEIKLRDMMQGDSFRYLKTPPCDMMTNFLRALNGAEGEFILMMGDDDSIFHFGESPDFSDLPSNIVGIKPCVIAYTDSRGVVAVNKNPLKASTAVNRITEDLKTTPGGNLTFFSFWRRGILMPLMELWLIHHPTKGNYCDWAMMHALASCGEVAMHPAASYFYNYHNWAGDDQAVLDQVEKAFLAAGLPAGSSAYAHLFNAIDSYIFINRKDSPVEAQERRLAAVYYLDFYLKKYLKKVPRNSTHENAKEILELSEKIDCDASILATFSLISDIFSAIRPGLDKQYKEFSQYAVDKPWGDI